MLKVDQDGNLVVASDRIDKLHGLRIARNRELLLANALGAQSQKALEHRPRLLDVGKLVREPHELGREPLGQRYDRVVAVGLSCEPIPGSRGQQYGQVYSHLALVGNQLVIAAAQVIRVLVKIDRRAGSLPCLVRRGGL